MTGFDRLFEECEKSLNFYSNHLNSLRKNIDLQEKARETLLKFDPQTDVSDFIEIEKINNYNGYITIAMIDLAVNLKNLIKSQTDWEKAFFIKNSYLIIHESSKKLKPFKGKSFIQQAIENKYQELNNNLKDMLEDIDNFRDASTYEKISNTRHKTAGHIDDSLKLYYDTILELNGEEAGNLISEFLKILNKALNLTKEFATIANNRQKEKIQLTESKLLLKWKELDNMLNK